MVSQLESEKKSTIIYPESDGKPMADNTKQFRWITLIHGNLSWLFANDEMVFVAGDLLWYPVEGNPKITQAPDVMVIFGVPKGDRGSYKQWEEDNIVPQVVFEILSPSNTQKEMNKKLLFYNRHGVEEYYIYDPDKHQLSGFLRSGEDLDVIDSMDNWESPRLGIRFDMSGEELQLYLPNGEIFQGIEQIKEQLQQKDEQLQQKDEQLQQKDEQLQQKDEQLELLVAKLREMGIDPDELK
ncbi:MAG: Uma2 family endonuclease [Okeania sp. SIO3B5]|uniref:Uma2 family endonuclease n=1 Tax=Okeania sp. SIO3B5 TaxID=2607811 RepID=UPI0014004B12|nr:Uma2 family endonuclease [Okeania sp. SIO3B5]NEO58712.1 Uma2 family endonuclease [Okeania sp. SIO3B5]